MASTTIEIYERYRPNYKDVRASFTEELPTIESVRKTLNGEVSKELNFADWLQQQPPAYQRRLFGSGPVGQEKYAGWKRGDIILTKLPPSSPISVATLQRRHGLNEPKIISTTPVVDAPDILPVRVQRRIKNKSLVAPEYNGNKLLSPSDIPSFNFDALAAFLHSLTTSQLQRVLPKSILNNWKANPTAGGLRYKNGKRLNFETTIRKLEILLPKVSI